jgi:hypothetical protein
MSHRQQAAERLGVRFHRCSQCRDLYSWDPDETFSVMTRPPDGGDYDDGNNQIEFCCSHLCASRLLAHLSDGIIWRAGKCGGTLMPPLEEP